MAGFRPSKQEPIREILSSFRALGYEALRARKFLALSLIGGIISPRWVPIGSQRLSSSDSISSRRFCV